MKFCRTSICTVIQTEFFWFHNKNIDVHFFVSFKVTFLFSFTGSLLLTLHDLFLKIRNIKLYPSSLLQRS